MRLRRYLLNTCIALSMLCSLLSAQQPAAPVASAVVPRLVNFSGKAVDADGKTISAVVGVTFAIYQEQTGGAPLWIETQNVQAGSKGSYTAQLPRKPVLAVSDVAAHKSKVGLLVDLMLECVEEELSVFRWEFCRGTQSETLGRCRAKSDRAAGTPFPPPYQTLSQLSLRANPAPSYSR